MIWEETYTNTLLRAALTRAILTSIEEAVTATATTTIQQVSVATSLAMPTAAVVSVSLCIVVLKAKNQYIATFSNFTKTLDKQIFNLYNI